MNLLRVTVLALACSVPALCFAQWQWIDKDGRKVFSDQPPPLDVPAKNILKQPAGRAAPSAAPGTAEAAVPVAGASQAAKPAASAPKLSGTDKDLDEKKKIAAAAEAEKKKAQDEEIARVRAENCTHAKRSKATIESGARLSHTNAKGEREIMDDTARGNELKRMDRAIASDCVKPQ